MSDTHIVMPIRGGPWTLSQVMLEIGRLQQEHPDREYFMDGDLYAIAYREREVSA